MAQPRYYTAYRDVQLASHGLFIRFSIDIEPLHREYGHWRFHNEGKDGDDFRAYRQGFLSPEAVIMAAAQDVASYNDIQLRWVPGEKDSYGIALSGTPAQHLYNIAQERQWLFLPASHRDHVPVYPTDTDGRLLEYRQRRDGGWPTAAASAQPSHDPAGGRSSGALPQPPRHPPIRGPGFPPPVMGLGFPGTDEQITSLPRWQRSLNRPGESSTLQPSTSSVNEDDSPARNDPLPSSRQYDGALPDPPQIQSPHCILPGNVHHPSQTNPLLRLPGVKPSPRKSAPPTPYVSPYATPMPSASPYHTGTSTPTTPKSLASLSMSTALDPPQLRQASSVLIDSQMNSKGDLGEETRDSSECQLRNGQPAHAQNGTIWKVPVLGVTPDLTPSQELCSKNQEEKSLAPAPQQGVGQATQPTDRDADLSASVNAMQGKSNGLKPDTNCSDSSSSLKQNAPIELNVGDTQENVEQESNHGVGSQNESPSYEFIKALRATPSPLWFHPGRPSATKKSAPITRLKKMVGVRSEKSKTGTKPRQVLQDGVMPSIPFEIPERRLLYDPNDPFVTQLLPLSEAVPCMDCGQGEIHDFNCNLAGIKTLRNLTMAQLNHIAELVEEFDPEQWREHRNPEPSPEPEDPESQLKVLAQFLRNDESVKSNPKFHGLSDQDLVMIWALTASDNLSPHIVWPDGDISGSGFDFDNSDGDEGGIQLSEDRTCKVEGATGADGEECHDEDASKSAAIEGNSSIAAEKKKSLEGTG